MSDWDWSVILPDWTKQRFPSNICMAADPHRERGPKLSKLKGSSKPSVVADKVHLFLFESNTLLLKKE